MAPSNDFSAKLEARNGRPLHQQKISVGGRQQLVAGPTARPASERGLKIACMIVRLLCQPGVVLVRLTWAGTWMPGRTSGMLGRGSLLGHLGRFHSQLVSRTTCTVLLPIGITPMRLSRGDTSQF